MRKSVTVVMLIFGFLLILSCAVYAQHTHDWSSWDYEKYNSSQHKKIQMCYECNQTNSVLESHKWVRKANEEEYYNSSQHYVTYECEDCYETKKTLENHIWEYPSQPVYSYGLIDDIYHAKTTDLYCKYCNQEKTVSSTEKHNLGFHKSYDKSNTYYGCDKCDYCYGDVVIENAVFRKVLKQKKKYTFKTIVLHKDGIKKISKIYGKKIFNVKKKRYNSFIIKAKKKGKGKIKVVLKSGVVYTYIFKFK